MSHDFEIIKNTRGKLIQKTKKHVLHDKFSCFNGLSIKIKEKIIESHRFHFYFKLKLICYSNVLFLHLLFSNHFYHIDLRNHKISYATIV